MRIMSQVKGFEGICAPTWLNSNQAMHRLDQGVTGFFKLVERRWWGFKRVGEEFHGIIRGNHVETTETKDPYLADDFEKYYEKAKKS